MRMDIKRMHLGGSAAIQYEDFNPISEIEEVLNANILLIYLPDFKRGQMKVTYVDSSRKLQVSGERTSAGTKRVRFNQAYPVPLNCEVTKIHAKFQNGVLTVTLPKKIDSQPSHTGAQIPTTDPRASKPEPKTPALSEKPGITPPLQPAREAKTTMPPPSMEPKTTPPPPLKEPKTSLPPLEEPKTAPLAPKKEPEVPSLPPAKEPKMAPLPPAKELRTTPPPPKEPKMASLPPSKEPKATLPALPQEPKALLPAQPPPPLPQQPQDSVINNNAIKKREIEETKLQEELSRKTKKSQTQHETEEDTKKRTESEVSYLQETAETSLKTSEKKKKKKKTDNESLKKMSKGDLVSEKFQGVKNLAAAAKVGMKGFTFDFDEDRQSIVNAGAAVLVIAAFGAYLSYKCGLFTSSKSNN